MASDLDQFERMTFDAADGAPVPGENPEAAAAAAAEAQSLAAIEAGVQRLVLFALKAARAYIARTVPEINEEWPDEVLKPPAEAAVPLLRRHLGQIMEIAGAHPEAAALVISVVPLALGYMAALDKHAKAADDARGAPGGTD